MILVDANLLLYATLRELPPHRRASLWLEERLGGATRVGLPWPSLLAFVRIVTNPRVFSAPLSLERAWTRVREWLAADVAWIPLPTEAHAEVLGRLLLDAGARGDLVPDAHLAALAIEHGLVLCSSDGDFARFRGLRWDNPLRD
jgi:toxin-antitoxin system PIN domain toxin